MSRDAEIATYLRTDDTLLALLPGGIYAWNEIGGFDGFRRGAHSPTAAAFDTGGILRPCMMVKEAARVPFGDIYDANEQRISYSQRVELYFYEDRGSAVIEQARSHTKSLLITKAFPGTYRLRWLIDTTPVPDTGPLKGSTAARQDYQIIGTRL